MRRLLSFALVALAAGAPARAESVRATAAFERGAVAPGEPVTFQISVQADSLPAGRVRPEPDLSAFDTVAGPSTGQSSEIRFVNGSMSKREYLNFSWQVVATKEGRITVPACTFTVGTMQVTTERVALEVTSSAAARRPQAGRGPGSRWDPRRPWSQPVRPAGEGLSVTTQVSNDRPFVGEAVVVKDVLKFNTNVSSYKERSPPEFSGFAKKRNSDIKPEGRRVQDPATGQAHSEATIGQWVIVPLVPGRKTLPGHEYSFFVPSPDQMEAIMGGEVEVPRESGATTLDVQPLPEGAPAGFSGAVGSFQVTATLAATDLRAGDGTQLVITVKGSGSFESVSAPELVLPPTLKRFDPEIVEDVSFGTDGQLHGRKTFTFPLLALQAGRHEVPAMEWSFFDPSAGRYVTRRCEGLALDVAPGGPEVAVATPAAPALEVQMAGSDIRHVRASLPPWSPDLSTRPMPSWLVGAAIAGPALNLALALWALAGRLSQRDPAQQRAAGAQALARRRLDQARAALEAGRTVEAADGASKAIAGLVSDRLGLGAELAPAEAAAAIAALGQGDLAARVERFLTGCDFVRFASGTSADANRLLLEGKQLLPLLARLSPPEPAP